MPRSDFKLAFQLAAEGLKGAGFFPGVEAIAGVPLKLIKHYEVIKANKDEMDQLVSTLDSFHQHVIEPLESARIHGHRYVPGLKERTEKLTESFLEMEACLGSFVSLGRWSGARKREEIAGALKDINRDLGRAITQFQSGGQITLEFEMWALAAERLLNTLRPDRSARFDASEKQPCLPNTRSALLATLRNHIHNSSDTFVCLYGSPGTGKSAVAKSIAAELQRDGLLAASYFFDKRGGDAGNISLATFVSTLVYHLARFSFDFHAKLSRQLKRDPLLADATADVRLRELLVEPLREVFSTRKPRRRWVIALDALDECGDSEHQRRLMGLLRSCAGLGEHIVFFLTCRPEVEITRVIQGWPVGPRAVIESMDEQDRAATTEDIQALVESKLLELKADEGWRFSPPLDDLQRFAALCRGLFELAAVRLRELARACQSTPLRDAFPLSLQTAERAVSSRSPLHDVYAGVLFAAYGSPQDRNRRRARLQTHHTLVGAMTAVQEPVTIQTLAALVGLEEDQARKALEPLSSVIAVPPDDNSHRDQPVHFYHASFLEFLLSEPSRRCSTLLRKCLISSTQSHASLAMRSLFLMNNMLHRNILDLPDSSVLNDTIPDLPLALDRHIPAHLRYACLHWANHLRVEDPSQSHGPLVQWCEEKIIFYIETISLLGEVERAVPLLLNAEDWARKVNIQASAATFLYDARRLVPMFHTAITQSAGAIYSSILPFMPECLLHERYHHLADEQVVLVDNQKRPSAWPSQIWSQPHPGSVDCVAVSPDGRYVASACDDHHVRILSAATGKVEQTLKGHYNRVYSVAFSSDGARWVSGSGDCSLCVWLGATGELEKMMKGHSQEVQSVAFSPNNLRIVSGSRDKTVYIWSVAAGAQERVLKGHTDVVEAVAFSPTGLQVVSGLSDNTLRIWSVVTGAQEQILTGHSDRVTSVAISLDGTRIISGSRDRSIRIWVAATGATEWVLEPQLQTSLLFSMVNSVAISPNGERVVFALADCTIHVWSTITGAEERVLDGHGAGAQSVAFFPDGKHIASGSMDRSVRVWSVTTGLQKDALDGHSNWVNSVAFSADGANIVSASEDSSLRLWSTLTGAQEQILQGHNKAVIAACFSPDGMRIASGSDDYSVRIWSTANGAQERVLGGHKGTVWSVAFSPDSRQIVSGSGDGSVRVWSVATGMQEQVVNVDRYNVYSVAFSLDGRHIVAGASNLFCGSVRVWNAATGAQEKQLFAPKRLGVNTVLFAANDHVVGCVDSESGSAAFWNVSSGLALSADDPRLPLQPWVKEGYRCAPDGWLTVHGHTFWVPRYMNGRWWSHPSGVLVLAPEDTPGKLVFIRLPTRT